jgi:hypothetical protein
MDKCCVYGQVLCIRTSVVYMDKYRVYGQVLCIWTTLEGGWLQHARGHIT